MASTVGLLTGLYCFPVPGQFADIQTHPVRQNVSAQSRAATQWILMNLRPRTPMSVIPSQQPIQWRWQNLQRTGITRELFITLLHIVIFGLDPSQARLLEVHCGLSHIFDPLQAWPEEWYAILSHLHRMATTAHEPILELLGRLSIGNMESTSPISHLEGLSPDRAACRNRQGRRHTNIPQPHGPSHAYRQSPLLASSTVGILCLSIRLGISTHGKTWP